MSCPLRRRGPPQAARCWPRSGRSATCRISSGREACERVIVSFHAIGERPLRRVRPSRASRTLRGRPRCNPCLCSSRGTSSRPPRTSSPRGSRSPAPRQLLRRRKRELQVMVGYSDSAKEAGVLAANLGNTRPTGDGGLGPRERRAAHDLPRTRWRARTRWRPRERAILGQPPGSVDGRFTVTEQGEMAFARYGHVARPAAPRATHDGGGARERRPRGGDPADRFDGRSRAWRTARARSTRPSCTPRVHAVLPARDPDRADLDAADRVAAGRPRHRRGRRARRPASDPVGLRVGSEPREPARLVRPRHRPRRGGRRAGRTRDAARCSRDWPFFTAH